MSPSEMAPLLGLVDDIPGLYNLLRKMFADHTQSQTNTGTGSSLQSGVLGAGALSSPHSASLNPTGRAFHYGSATDAFLHG